MRLSATLRYCATGALSLIVTGVWARTGVATKPSPKTAANRGRQWRAFISRLAPGERRTLVLQHQRLEGTAAGPPPQPGEIAQGHRLQVRKFARGAAYIPKSARQSGGLSS